MHTTEKVWTTRQGHKAVVLMYHDAGHRCGYVGISSSHPLYQKSYSENCVCLSCLTHCTGESPIGKRGIIPVFCAMASGGITPRPDIIFDVHGGITYSEGANWDYRYPTPNTNLWWFGYDCGHAGDGRELSVLPKVVREIEERFPNNDPVRSLDYCVKECESLSEQLEFVEINYRKLLFKQF